MFATLAAIAVALFRLRTTLLASAAFVLLVIALLFGTLARAAPVALDPLYDFSLGPQGWTSQTVSYNGSLVPNAWTWGGGSWHVDPTAVPNPRYWTGSYLTSPVIDIVDSIDVLQFDIVQRFRFPQNITTGAPVVAGELVYRVFDAANPNTAFQPFATGAFANGTLPPPLEGMNLSPNWVAPTFVAPADRPPLVPAGGTWIGSSPGYDGGMFVASRATLTGLTPGQEVEFRLINANLGLQCDGGGWDVASVRITGFAPEPGAVGLAASGGGLAVACGLVRGWRRRRQQPTGDADSDHAAAIPATARESIAGRPRRAA